MLLFGLVVGVALLAGGMEKLRKSLKEWAAGPPPASVEVPDQEAIRRQIEDRLRSEFEQELGQRMTKLKLDTEKEVAERVRKEEAQKQVKPSEPPLGDITDVRKLRSEILFKSRVETKPGGQATVERADKESYAALYQLSVRVPTAVRTMAELERAAPKLGKTLPGLPALLEKAVVSPWFKQLYDNKVALVRRNAHTLTELPTRHNFYDCDTILHARATDGTRVFLMQAEMDVVADGSDGDRLATMPDGIVNSTHYQPFTSYGWPKQSSTPNPMVAGWEARIANANAELKDSKTTAQRRRWLIDRIAYLKRGIADMQARSFLIAEYDPFIVIPVNILTSRDAFAPNVGDFAVVVYDGVVYPAIVGDGGPTSKVGEASLRMAKQLNPRATPYNRPVSDLKVTYMVFPGSRDEKKGPPDYAAIRARCESLLGKIGGLGEGVALHQWEDLLPKEPETSDPPTASGEPAPAAMPEAPKPAASGTPE